MLRALDQTRLPGAEVELELADGTAVVQAIQRLAIRGAPLIGVAAGYLMGDGTAWRDDRRKLRLFSLLTLAWAALFFVRLAVQYPLFLAGDATALGTWKLVLGLPLYAPLLVLTVLAVRAEYRGAAERDEAAPPAERA